MQIYANTKYNKNAKYMQIRNIQIYKIYKCIQIYIVKIDLKNIIFKSLKCGML